MTLENFNKNILAKIDFKQLPNRIDEIPIKTRVILAIADCRVALFPNEYTEYCNILSMLEEIESREKPKLPSKQDLILESANVWKINPKMLIECIKRILQAS